MRKMNQRLFITLIVAVCVLVVTLSSYHRLKSIAYQECEARLDETHDSVDLQFSHFMAQERCNLEDYAEYLAERWGEIASESMAREISQKRIGVFESPVRLLLENGMAMTEAGKIENYRVIFKERDFFAEDGYWTNLFEDRLCDDARVLYQAVPVRVNGKTAAMLVEVIFPEKLNTYIKVESYEGKANAVLFDRRDGSIVLDTKGKAGTNIYEEVERRIGNVSKYEAWKGKVLELKTAMMETVEKKNNINLYCYTKPCSFPDYSVCVFVEKKLGFASSNRVRDTFLMYAVLEVVALMLCAIYFIQEAQREYKTKLAQTTDTIDDLSDELKNERSFSEYLINNFEYAFYVNLLRNTFEVREAKIDIPYDERQDGYVNFVEYFISRFVHIDDRAKVREMLQPDYIRDHVNTENGYPIIFRMVRENLVRWYKIQIFRGADANHIALGCVDISNEVAAKEEAEKNDRRREQVLNVLTSDYLAYYYLSLEEGNTGIHKLFLSDTISSQVSGMIDPNENLKGFVYEIADKYIHPEDRDQFLTQCKRSVLKNRLKENKRASFVVRWRLNDAYYYYKILVVKAEGPAETPKNIAFGLVDIDADYREQLLHRETEERAKLLKIYSNTDTLTGLRNRRAYEERLRKLVECEYIGVVFCDMNRLKYTNDHFGHAAGDELLTEFATMLRNYAADEDIFRISGDEFILVFENTTEQEFFHKIQKLKETNEKRDWLCSVGAVYGEGVSVLQLVNEAEKEMYEEKALFHKKYPKFAR